MRSIGAALSLALILCPSARAGLRLAPAAGLVRPAPMGLAGAAASFTAPALAPSFSAGLPALDQAFPRARTRLDPSFGGLSPVRTPRAIDRVPAAARRNGSFKTPAVRSGRYRLAGLPSQSGPAKTRQKVPLERRSFNGRPAVALYRVMSAVEHRELRTTGKFSMGPVGLKGFSFFWRGSISEKYRTPAGREGSYSRAVRVYVSPEFFASLLEEGEWMPGLRGENAVLMKHPSLRKESVFLMRNSSIVKRKFAGRRVFDEITLWEGALDRFNDHVLGFETIGP